MPSSRLLICCPKPVQSSMISIKLAKNSKQSWKMSYNAQKRPNENFRQRSPGQKTNETSGKFVFPSINALPILITPFFRTSLCLFKQRTILPRRPSNANSINSDKNTRRQRYIHANWKWEMTIWSATSAQSLPVWLIWSPSIQGYWRKRFCWNTNS